jgi:hypothetical protein
MQQTLKIPKQLAQKGDLVLIPQAEYEEFLNWQKIVKIFEPTKAEKEELAEARQDFYQGNYISLNQLKDELANHNSSQGS